MDIIKSDLYRYQAQTSILKGLKAEGFQFIYFWRKASLSKARSIAGLFYRYQTRRLKQKLGIQIPVGTEIGEGLFIGHFGNIVVNGGARIGKNCNLAHGVTIGKVSTGKLKGIPTIGDHVWIGTGCVIVGNITIGSDVFIAPNTFVNMDVPDHSIVIGNPAKVKRKPFPTKGYINHVKNVAPQKVSQKIATNDESKNGRTISTPVQSELADVPS